MACECRPACSAKRGWLGGSSGWSCGRASALLAGQSLAAGLERAPWSCKASGHGVELGALIAGIECVGSCRETSQGQILNAA